MFGVPTPLILMLTLEGVQGARYSVVDAIYDHRPAILSEDILKLPECILEEYGTELDHHKAVRPAFDALWNAIGYPRSKFFNDDGLWVGGPTKITTLILVVLN